MTAAGLALFGWLVPGGAYLLKRRYLQFAGFACLVCVTFALGIALDGGYRWPQPTELQGLDGFTALFFQASALTKVLAGGPFLIAGLFDGAHSFVDGRVHEYGSTLLVMAGVFNVLAISNALESRREGAR